MSRVPRVTGGDLVSALNRAGFGVIRIRGSHYLLRHEDGRSTVVPVHGKDTLGPGLVRQIMRDCEISLEEVLDLLHG